MANIAELRRELKAKLVVQVNGKFVGIVEVENEHIGQPEVLYKAVLADQGILKGEGRKLSNDSKVRLIAPQGKAVLNIILTS